MKRQIAIFGAIIAILISFQSLIIGAQSGSITIQGQVLETSSVQVNQAKIFNKKISGKRLIKITKTNKIILKTKKEIEKEISDNDQIVSLNLSSKMGCTVIIKKGNKNNLTKAKTIDTKTLNQNVNIIDKIPLEKGTNNFDIALQDQDIKFKYNYVLVEICDD